MKEFLDQIWQDLKQRKNLELYLGLAAIIVVFIADVAGINTDDALFEITLAVLAVLLYGTLETRHADEIHGEKLAELTQSLSKISLPEQDFLSNKWSPSLKEEMEQADELWLVGVSLVTTVKTNFELLEKKLRQGNLIKVMVSNPEGVGVDIAVSRNYGRRDTEQKRSDIHRTLSDLCEINRRGTGQLEVRTTRHPLAYGAIVICPQSSVDGRIYVENYGFRVKADGFPVFSLRPSHGEWYEFYKLELSYLWEDAQKWECGEDS